MCLGIPGRVLDRYEEQGLAMGKVDFDGICRPVCLAHTPEVMVGEYVLVHVGFALQILEADDAITLQAMLRELAIDSAEGEPIACEPIGSPHSLESRMEGKK